MNCNFFSEMKNWLYSDRTVDYALFLGANNAGVTFLRIGIRTHDFTICIFQFLASLFSPHEAYSMA